MSEDEDVGYGRPPRRSRFKKGRSGNPRGRRKGRKNMSTIVKDVFEQTVTIKENGKTRRVKFSEAFVRQLAAKALNGSTRDQIALFKLMIEYAPEFLKGPQEPHEIQITYVLPDGKTMEDYDEINQSMAEKYFDPKTSPTNDASDSPSDEDDSWLD